MELFEEAARGDRAAVAVRDRCLNVWAANAVGLVHTYDPEIILIGGGVMKSADVISLHRVIRAQVCVDNVGQGCGSRRRTWEQCGVYGSRSAFVTKHRSPRIIRILE
jgi:predicted NBD/HSP70 family sugar kinase